MRHFVMLISKLCIEWQHQNVIFKILEISRQVPKSKHKQIGVSIRKRKKLWKHSAQIVGSIEKNTLFNWLNK